MKKKLLALVLSIAMASTLLVGCGDDEEEAVVETEVEEVEEETAAEEEAADVEEAAPEEAGFTFEDLQDNYATMVEAYNSVEELYMNEGIAQDDTVEELLTQCKDVMDQMGELTRDDFETEEDLLTMNDSIVTLLDSLNGIIDLMSEADTSGAEATADADDTEAVLKAAFPVGYAGAADDGSKILWALSEDTTRGIFVVINADESDAVAMVGDVVNNGDETITLTDDESGAAVVLGVSEDVDDEGTTVLMLETEDGGLSALYEVPGENVIDALLSY